MSPAYAHAGAWIAPKGGQTIINVAAGQRGDAAVYETSSYFEGSDDGRLSWIANAWSEYAQDNPEGTRAEIMLGAKYPILRTDTSAMAVQAGAIWLTNPREGCSEGGAELRWLGGMNLPRRTFANLELAGRALDGGEECIGSRVDLTLGYQPNDRWLALGQVFVDAPLDGEESVKAQFSLIRFRPDGRRGIQVGLRVRLDGGEPEPALVLGLWRRPDPDGD